MCSYESLQEIVMLSLYLLILKQLKKMVHNLHSLVWNTLWPKRQSQNNLFCVMWLGRNNFLLQDHLWGLCEGQWGKTATHSRPCISVCVWVCVFMCPCVAVWVSICEWMCVCVPVSVHVSISLSLYVSVWIFVCESVSIFVHMSVCVCMCVCVCVCEYVYGGG